MADPDCGVVGHQATILYTNLSLIWPLLAVSQTAMLYMPHIHGHRAAMHKNLESLMTLLNLAETQGDAACPQYPAHALRAFLSEVALGQLVDVARFPLVSPFAS